MNVLIAPDKFKGTLTGKEAAHAIRDGWKKARPKDNLRTLPICDGGDGFGEAIAGLENAQTIQSQTMDAAHRPITASWWWQESQKIAIIESACIIGLAQLPASKYHPFHLDTFGLGEVLKQAIQKGAQTCVMGIGGSATNDGGFGMAKALGWGFRTQNQEEICSWTDLDRLAIVEKPKKTRLFKKFIIASDVENLLLGKEGASRIYGPQKGLIPKDIRKSEACLKALARHVDARMMHDWRLEAGGGAAGGLGYGLMAFLGGKAQSGFDYFSRRASLNAQLKWADIVITGEGSLDKSTLMGKGVGSIAKKCNETGKDCIGLAGAAQHLKQLSCLFKKVYKITPTLTNQASAQNSASKWLKILAENAANDIQL